MPATRIAPDAASGSNGAAIVDHSSGPVARCAPSCSKTMAAPIALAADPAGLGRQQHAEDAHVGERPPGRGVRGRAFACCELLDAGSAADRAPGPRRGSASCSSSKRKSIAAAPLLSLENI